MLCRQSATDDQCSSVGRTQSSDAGVGDESAVVSQVAWEWDVAGHRPMNKRDDLVADALLHRKPVQLAKHRLDVVTCHIVACQ